MHCEPQSSERHRACRRSEDQLWRVQKPGASAHRPRRGRPPGGSRRDGIRDRALQGGNVHRAQDLGEDSERSSDRNAVGTTAGCGSQEKALSTLPRSASTRTQGAPKHEPFRNRCAACGAPKGSPCHGKYGQKLANIHRARIEHDGSYKRELPRTLDAGRSADDDRDRTERSLGDHRNAMRDL